MKINKNIIGYEFVKNVKKVEGYERCGCDLLIVYKRSRRDEYDITEVAENTEANRKALKAKYPFEDFIIHWGTTYSLPKGAYALPEGGDILALYLS